MKQYEAVIKVMEENGGFSTLGHLYQHVLKLPDCKWRTKTPYASIRRIVQDDRFFFKIKPGLWALKSHREDVLKKFSLDEKSSEKKKEEFSHSYYQGLLIEIGNLKGFETFVPNQDKNKKFLEKPLKEISTLNSIYPFTFPEILKKVKTIDVIWFNNRKFPARLFEVEHTTDFYNSLLKFNELQDFLVNFYIVSSTIRKNLFNKKLDAEAFRIIRQRVRFLDYENLSKYHAQCFELFKTEKNIGF